MKRHSFISRTALSFALMTAAGLAAISCGQLEDMVQDRDEDSQLIASDTDTANLIDSAFSNASGSSDPSIRRFPLDSPHEDVGIGPRGQHRGEHGSRKHGKRGRHGAALQIPDDIKELMTQADAKRDSILGIDRAKVTEIVDAMRTDLEALRSVAVTREEFEAQAKTIVDKYAAELRTVIPAFDTLTQEQKDQVKAIHDLQKGVIKACVARGSDSAGETCTAAKTALQSQVAAE